MDAKTKEIVDHWDEVQQKMIEAEETINSTIKDWAGDLGTNLRDALVEAFRNNDLYSAIDSFHDYVEEVIENLMAQAIFAAVFQDKFDQLQKDLHDNLSPASWMEILGKFVQDLESESQLVFDGLSYVKDAAKKLGLTLYDASDSDSDFTNGLKAMTEDTASLIASYINAMRADVSVIRMLQVQGWQDVKAIRALMPPPTVWEYFAKIEAHTSNIARASAATAASNAAILQEIRSVITSEDGAPAVRTSM